MNTKDQLVKYLTKGYVHVSKTDFQFFYNLIKISEEGRVTTGQDSLLLKLVEKYRRQLEKEGHNIEILKNLPWSNPLLVTTDNFKTAYISTEKNKIIFKSPFSKKFINELRNKNVDNTFLWNKQQKVYISDMSTLALKTIVDVASKVFPTIIFSEDLDNVLQNLKTYENLLWEPTLFKINNYFYITACNESLFHVTKDIKLNDNPNTLFELTKYGIKIDQSVITDKLKKFASTYYYETDNEHLDEVILFLKALSITTVGIVNRTHRTHVSNVYKNLRQKLSSNNITIVDSDNLHENPGNVLISFRANNYNQSFILGKAVKIIVIKNNTPIEIK